MNFLSITSDDGGGDYANILSSELNSLEELINQHYAEPSFSIGIVVRCLPDRYKRKSFQRFYKEERHITIDITLSLDTFRTLSMTECREITGSIFFSCLTESLQKYTKAYPDYFSGFDISQFIMLVETWLREHDWVEGKVFRATKLLTEGKSLKRLC
jgi:hypothetical protein